MKPLYEITSEIDALIDEAINVETGEIRDEELSARLDELEQAKDAKALNIACVIVDLESEAERVATRFEELRSRSQALMRKAAWLRSYLAACFEVGSKLKDDRVALSVTNGKERVVVDIDAKYLPAAYQRVTIDANKAALLEDLSRRVMVRGARLVRGPRSVRIR